MKHYNLDMKTKLFERSINTKVCYFNFQSQRIYIFTHFCFTLVCYKI